MNLLFLLTWISCWTNSRASKEFRKGFYTWLYLFQSMRKEVVDVACYNVLFDDSSWTAVGGPGVARLRSDHHRSTWLPLRRLPGSGGVVTKAQRWPPRPSGVHWIKSMIPCWILKLAIVALPIIRMEWNTSYFIHKYRRWWTYSTILLAVKRSTWMLADTWNVHWPKGFFTILQRFYRNKVAFFFLESLIHYPIDLYFRIMYRESKM